MGVDCETETLRPGAEERAPVPPRGRAGLTPTRRAESRPPGLRRRPSPRTLRRSSFTSPPRRVCALDQRTRADTWRRTSRYVRASGSRSGRTAGRHALLASTSSAYGGEPRDALCRDDAGGLAGFALCRDETGDRNSRHSHSHIFDIPHHQCSGSSRFTDPGGGRTWPTGSSRRRFSKGGRSGSSTTARMRRDFVFIDDSRRGDRQAVRCGGRKRPADGEVPGATVLARSHPTGWVNIGQIRPR